MPGRTKVGSECYGRWQTNRDCAPSVGRSLQSSGRGPPVDMKSAPLFSRPRMWRALREKSCSKAQNHRSSASFRPPCLYTPLRCGSASYQGDEVLENQKHCLKRFMCHNSVGGYTTPTALPKQVPMMKPMRAGSPPTDVGRTPSSGPHPALRGNLNQTSLVLPGIPSPIFLGTRKYTW